jgi:hypothetical protein
LRLQSVRLWIVLAAAVWLVGALTNDVTSAAPGLRIAGYAGVAINGATIMLTGSGFGEKNPVTPLKWDDFETGAEGQLVSGWQLESVGPGAGLKPDYSSAVRRPNSGMSMRARFTGGDWNSSLAITGRTWDKVYLDAWVYLDETPPYSRNNKLFRLYSGTLGQPTLYYNLYCEDVDASHFSQDGVPGGNNETWSPVRTSYFARRWAHLQVYLEESGVAMDNGTAVMWVNGVKLVDNVRNFRTRVTDAHWNSLYIGHYLAHDAAADCGEYGDAYAYWDDVYVDTTQARVEIGDAPTYSNTRRREIQIPSSWSDTSVSITVNQGAFANLGALYLFVIDAAGNVSPGYPLVDSGAPPSPPTNLRIVPPR